MISKDDSLVARVQTSYQKLATAAATLNTASDQLGQVVLELDAAIKTLNLGVSSWFRFSHGESPDGLFYSYDEIGYDKVGGRWGIAIKSVSARADDPDPGELVDVWQFNDAPRRLRIEAVGKIPELLENLIKDADATAKEINEQLKLSQELTAAIQAIAKKADKDPQKQLVGRR